MFLFLYITEIIKYYKYQENPLAFLQAAEKDISLE